MATCIIITDENDNSLKITSDKDTIDFGNDAGGARKFKVNAPYDLDPALTEGSCSFASGSANVNGDIFSGETITVTEYEGQNVEIIIQ